MPVQLRVVIGVLVAYMLGNLGSLALFGLDTPINLGPAMGSFAGGPILSMLVQLVCLVGLARGREWGRRLTLFAVIVEAVWSGIELFFLFRHPGGWVASAAPILDLVVSFLVIALLTRPRVKQWMFARALGSASSSPEAF